MLTNNNNRMWLVQHSAKGVHLTQEKQTLESVLRQHNAWVKSERCTQRKVKKKTEITSGKHAQFVSWVSEFKVNWLQKEEECIDSQNWRVEESGGHLRRRLGQVRSGDSNIIFISLSLSFALSTSSASAVRLVDFLLLDFHSWGSDNHCELQISPPDCHLTHPQRMRKFCLPKSTNKAQDSSRIDLAQNLPFS